MTGSANANLRSDCIIRRHVFKQLVSKLNTKYISISLRYRDIINTYFLELSWFIFKGLAYMQLCKPKWRCLVLFRRRLSPGNTFKQHILVQSLSNCVLKNFKIPTAACRVGDLALGFFFAVSLSIAQSDLVVNLLIHPFLGRMWHCIDAHLNPPDQQTAKTCTGHVHALNMAS